MIHLNADQIAARAAEVSGKASVALINRLYRKQDESHLFPICARFDATERAIRRIRKARREGMIIDDGLEYAYALEAEISNIVNSEC
jgi:hypothetical protein